MPYAIAAYFDAPSDERIRSLWKLMADEDICDYLHRSQNNPHIKLAMFDAMDVERMRLTLEAFVRDESQVPLHFKSYGFYPSGGEPMIFIDVAATAELLALQQRVRGALDGVGTAMATPFMDKGIWKPDTLLTVRIGREKLGMAMNLLVDKPLPFDGAIARLGLIEFHPAKQLFDYALERL